MLTIVDVYFVNKLGMDGPWRLIVCIKSFKNITAWDNHLKSPMCTYCGHGHNVKFFVMSEAAPK